MAAAANLVEHVAVLDAGIGAFMWPPGLLNQVDALKTALFAAQHSKSRREPPCPPCLLVDDADVRAHSEREEETPLYHVDGPRANCPRCQQLDRIAHCWKAR